MAGNRKKSIVLLAALLLFFLGMLAVFGVGVYNDSDQYLKMHIHREPLYPLFLALCRTLFGGAALPAAAVLQNLLAAASIWLMAEYVSRRFGLGLPGELAVTALELFPHLMTKFFSSLHLFMSNSVMSEAVCLPLFTLFMMECMKLLDGERHGRRKGSGPGGLFGDRALWLALVLALLLSLTRGQLMTTLLIWAAVVIVRAVRMRKAGDRRALRAAGSIGVICLLTVLAFGARTLLVRSYNLAFNGRFINNTYGTVNTLTNVLYAADREDGEGIKDPEARDFFYRMYDLTEERQANHHYAGSGPAARTRHIEQWHDTIKYEMIEDVFYQTYDNTVTTDYITQNLMADRAAGKIIAGVLPRCFGRWFANYLLIAHYGLIRSIAVVHPLINWLAAALYLAAAGLTLHRFLRRKNRDAAWVMLLALLSVGANVSATSLTIMCLSRYMIYGFPLFYIAFYLLLGELWRERTGRDNRENVGKYRQVYAAHTKKSEGKDE